MIERSKKKLLVTGASGFIGSFLVQEALNQNFEIWAGIRKNSSKKNLQDPNIKFIILDFENPSSLGELLAFHKFDYIIHNAGITKAKNKDTFFNVNTTFLKTLVNQIIEKNVIPDKLIFISSLAAYGPADNQKSNHLNSSSKPYPVTAYGESKLKAEQFLIEKVKEIPFLIFRPTAVYGPKEKDVFALIDLINRHLELYVGKGTNIISFIYVKDLVRLIIDSLTSKHENKSYFVGDGNDYTSHILNAKIKKILNKKTISIHIPLGIIWLLSLLLEKTASIVGTFPILNREKFNEIKCQSWALDCAPIKEDFNFVPRYDLEEGLRETIIWYKQHNWI